MIRELLTYGMLTLAALGGATNSFAQPSAGLYYNISADPNSLTLLDLDNIGDQRGKKMLTVVDLFRGVSKHGVVSTWEIDCASERMRVAKAMQFSPAKSGSATLVNGAPITARETPRSWTTFKLVCTGGGDLAERRVFRGPLKAIVTRFWGL